MSEHKITVTLGEWPRMKEQAQRIRMEVFVQEQNVPAELEMDQMDAHCIHAIACNAAGEPVGTGRLLPDGHIGRMAVRKVARGSGVGGLMLQALMACAHERGDRVLALSAQTHAAPFYLRHGFVVEGEEFYEAGIAHINMVYRY